MSAIHDDPEAAAYVALHEAGHAVAAVVLGFEVRSILIEGPESSGPGHRIYGVVGETNSSASDVSTSEPDADLRRRCAVVGMAGRAARRLKHPDAEHDADHLELHDREQVTALLGGDEELDAVSREAAELIEAHRGSVEALVSQLIAKQLPIKLLGHEVVRLVKSTSLRGRPWTRS